MSKTVPFEKFDFSFFLFFHVEIVEMCQRAHKKKCLFTGFFFRLGCSLHIYSFFAYDLSRQIIKPFWTHFKTDFVCSNLTVLPIGKLVTFKIAIQFKVTFFVVCLYNCRFSFHKLAFFSLDICILLEENIYMKMAFEIIV